MAPTNPLQSGDEEQQRFFELVDAQNAEEAGGPPTTIEQHLGNLKIRSGTIAFGDPQVLPDVELPNIPSGEVSISATLWQYPSDGVTCGKLTIQLADDLRCDRIRKIGELGIDSAALVVVDKADYDEYWTETGKDRIGVISTAPDDTMLRRLKSRFQLETVQINAVRAEVVGPVSEILEREIEDYLRSIPKYAEYPFLCFRLETNNSFDRVVQMNKAWEFIPVGNDELPMMFVCSTGLGDGLYDVNCGFAGDVPVVVTIPFIEDD